MTLADVQELQAKLEKQARAAEPDFELVTDILRSLEALPITKDILTKTKIGKTVQKIKRLDGAEAAKAAKRVIKTWKALVIDGPKPFRPVSSPEGDSAGASKESESNSPAPPTETVSTATANGNGGAASESGAPERPSTPDSWQDLPSKRRIVRRKLSGALRKSEERGDNVYEAAEEIEEAMQELHDFESADSTYQQKFRMLFTNLGSNRALAREVLCSELKPAELVRMSTNDMLSEEVRRERANVQQMNREAISLDWEQKNRDKIYKDLGIEGGVGQYPCPKCKSKNTSYYLKQTRSADEPMTVFCSCDDCRNRWRIYG